MTEDNSFWFLGGIQELQMKWWIVRNKTAKIKENKPFTLEKKAQTCIIHITMWFARMCAIDLKMNS